MYLVVLDVMKIALNSNNYAHVSCTLVIDFTPQICLDDFKM